MGERMRSKKEDGEEEGVQRKKRMSYLNPNPFPCILSRCMCTIEISLQPNQFTYLSMLIMVL